jgi:hypothetical protein
MPAIAKGLLDRDLLRPRAGGVLPRLFFTVPGWPRRGMMADRRFADPRIVAHVRQELGIDPVAGDRSA